MKYKMVDFNQLSDWGLIHKINKEVLHPLGLALSRDIDGTSPGALVAPDLVFEYPFETDARNYEKYTHFIENRSELLSIEDI